MIKYNSVIILFGSFSVLGSEPVCSRFHYEEQTLEKMIRQEILVEKMKADLEDLKKVVVETVTHTEEYNTEIERHKVNGGWSEWADWGTCSMTCGTGLKKRNRSCSNTYPQKTGTHCFGDSLDVEICKQKACIDQTQVIAFRSDTVADMSLSDNNVLVFTRNTLKIGDGYNNKTGIFVAPVAGLYQFTAQICLTALSYTHFGIKINGEVITKTLFGDNDLYNCNTMDVLAAVGLADEVSVNCVASCDSTDKLHRNSYMQSSFSGLLVAKIN